MEYQPTQEDITKYNAVLAVYGTKFATMAQAAQDAMKAGMGAQKTEEQKAQDVARFDEWFAAADGDKDGKHTFAEFQALDGLIQNWNKEKYGEGIPFDENDLK